MSEPEITWTVKSSKTQPPILREHLEKQENDHTCSQVALTTARTKSMFNVDTWDTLKRVLLVKDSLEQYIRAIRKQGLIY